MTYTVNATISMPAWIDVEADSEREAIELAKDQRPQDYETDPGAATLEFNVTPTVAEYPF